MLSFEEFKINESIILHHSSQSNLSDLDVEKILSKEEIEHYTNFKSEKRKREFLSIRILLSTYLNTKTEIKYRNEKPYIKGMYISISHKDNEILIGLNKNNEIGIDIEKSQTTLDKIIDKFCNEKDLHLNNTFFKTKNKVEALTKLWAAKEATFKCLTNQTNVFIKNITIKLIDSTNGFAEINNEIFELHFKTIKNDYVICHSQKSMDGYEYFR
jgi:phosphopantetheinyl transferase